jgi:hypothetical protein
MPCFQWWIIIDKRVENMSEQKLIECKAAKTSFEVVYYLVNSIVCLFK